MPAAQDDPFADADPGAIPASPGTIISAVAAEPLFTAVLNEQGQSLAELVDATVMGRDAQELFGGMSYADLGECYDAAENAMKAASLYRGKVLSYVEARILQEGLSEGTTTEKRGGPFVFTVTKEFGTPSKASNFEVLVDEMEAEAGKAGFAAEAERCITRVMNVTVNRTFLKSLVKAGGRVAEIAGKLYSPVDKNDYKPKTTIKRIG